MNKTIEIIKKGGIIAITAVLLFIIWQVIQGYQTTIGNHIEHNTSAWVEVKEVMIGVGASVDANTTQLQRLETLIDKKL